METLLVYDKIYMVVQYVYIRVMPKNCKFGYLYAVNNKFLGNVYLCKMRGVI